MNRKEIERALNDSVKYGILEKSIKGYRYDKKRLTKLGKGIKSKGKYAVWIEILYRSGYFEIARTEKEIGNMITLLTLE